MHLLKNDAEEIIRGTKIGKQEKEKEDDFSSYKMFSELHDFVSTACKLYKEEKITWDESMDELAKIFTRLKGKEEKLKKAAKKEDSDMPMSSY